MYAITETEEGMYYTLIQKKLRKINTPSLVIISGLKKKKPALSFLLWIALPQQPAKNSIFTVLNQHNKDI